MTITNWTMTDTLEFNGPRVLLVESDRKALRNHTYMLILHRFTVTRAEKASSGMSRILNGDTFDCIVVDADKSEMVMVDFVRQSLKRLPQVFVIVMGSNDIRRWICKDAEDYKVVSFLPKPCGIKEISDMLKHIFRDRMVFEEDTSIEKLIQEYQERNFFHRFGTLVRPSAIFNTTMIRNNISFRNGARQGLNMNSLEHAVMSRPVAYVDLASDDDESSLRKNICPRTTRIQDKGKKPMEQKRKKYQPYEYDTYLKKRKETKTRTAWTSALQDIKETLIGFDKKKAYRNTSLKQKNMPAGLPCYHTASYLQDRKERENNNMNKSSVVTWMQEGNNFQVESYACKRFGLSIPSDKDTSILEARYPEKQPLKLNSAGASFMAIENIKAKLCEAPPFSLSQQTTTPVNNASGYLAQPLIVEASTNSGFGVVEHPHTGTGQQIETQTIQAGYRNGIEPLVTDGNFSQPTVEEEIAPSVVDVLGESQLDLGITNAYNYSNGFDNTNYLSIGDINVSEALAPIDRFGVLVETSVTGVGGIIEAPSKDGLEDLTFPDGENLFDDEDSNSETLTFGHQNPNFSDPSIPGEEVNTEADTQPPINSILPYDGSEGRVMDEDWYVHLIHHDHDTY